MKQKILYLVIGVLIGAIITAAGFLIYNSNNQQKNIQGGPEQMQFEGKGERPSGEKPDGQPPAKPEENSNNTNQNQT